MAKPQPRESQIKRATRSLDMLLVGWDGALSTDSALSADYRATVRATVRAATYRARQALRAGTLTPAEVMTQIITPVFETTDPA